MILSWTATAPEPAMPEDILLDLRDTVAGHPWWMARARLAISYLRRLGVAPGASVLDAGCGWGVNIEALERSGYRAIGLDVSQRALEALDGEGRILIHADLARPLPASIETFDAILALDVIEHVDVDREALQNLARLTRPGGILIVSVPALMSLALRVEHVLTLHGISPIGTSLFAIATRASRP
jgi:2-polyprenyl-3-methyl-5-hydroxy-6-metoxy-1,4-benzoquinol methylase